MYFEVAGVVPEDSENSAVVLALRRFSHEKSATAVLIYQRHHELLISVMILINYHLRL